MADSDSSVREGGGGREVGVNKGEAGDEWGVNKGDE